MEKEIILENLDESIVNEATFYSQQNIPSQISQALYLYGSTTDYQVLGFIDASGDGSKGMIFTDQGIYFCFKEPHFFLYEDIEKLEVVAKKKYMSIGSPLAYEAYVSDFKFTFKNGQTFYFYWPMILNDDARYIAIIVEKKVKHIEDPYNILYAMKQCINLNDYLIGR